MKEILAKSNEFFFESRHVEFSDALLFYGIVLVATFFSILGMIATIFNMIFL